MNKLPDIQEDTKPDFPMHIQRVGIDNLKVPIKISQGGFCESVEALISIFINLDKNIRAISMGELLRSLRSYLYKDINYLSLRNLLDDFRTASKEKSHTSIATFKFNLSKIKTSPKSNISFPMYYPCIIKGVLNIDNFKIFKGVTVPYTSYCPCSKSLVDSVGFGISHNQRSFCDLFVEFRDGFDIQFNELINMVEDSVINRIYPVLRRIDEQHVAILAHEYNNQLFVEDSIRRITHNIKSNKKIKDYYIKVTHEESLHQHNAVAINWKGIENGFNQYTMIG